MSIKRALRIAIPAATLLLGATVYAATGRSNDCGNPSIIARVMKATGMGHIQFCDVYSPPAGEGVLCIDQGHHCNIGNGPGKCKSNVDPVTYVASCQCQ